MGCLWRARCGFRRSRHQSFVHPANRGAGDRRTISRRRAPSACCRCLFWTLIITVSIKYCLIVMRADNRGEGGILALMSLIGANALTPGIRLLTGMGLLGAALIYGDGVITPAISVLSALEGVNVVTDSFKPYVMPDGGGHSSRPVCRAALRHGKNRPRLRTGDVAMVCGNRSSRRRIDRAPSGRHRRHRPAPCGALHGGFGPHRFLGSGRRISLHHRRGGAVRRHGTLRQGAHPPVLVLRGAAGAAPELRGSGRVFDGQGNGHGQSVLSNSAVLVDLSAGIAGNRRPPSSPARPSLRVPFR